MSYQYKVVEIFNSIDGEGKFAGAPASFIRLHGCNLRCVYCDTAYSYDGTFTWMTLDEILNKMDEKKLIHVTLTGGEPLLAADADKLIEALLIKGYIVNIETNGSIGIDPIICYLNNNKTLPMNTKNLIFTMDHKLPSSGETSRMDIMNLMVLRKWDVLKFVVGSESDMKYMVSILERLKNTSPGAFVPEIYVGAVFEKYPLTQLAEDMLKYPVLKDARMQLQFHKIIWDPNMQGV